jgi:hypothetical protein
MTSIALGAAAVVAGLVVSFHHGTAGGATIAGFSVLQFFIVLIAREFVVALRHRGSPRSNQPDQAIASLAPGSLP